MKKILMLLCVFLVMSVGMGCNKRQLDFNGAIRNQSEEQGQQISQKQAVQAVMAHESVKALEKKGKAIVVEEIVEPTEDDPVWEIHIKEEESQVIQVYGVNAFTAEVLGVYVKGSHDHEVDDLKPEMTEHVKWAFEQWQSFHHTSYDPSRYGLAFALNFRLAYIFDNYDQNKERVEREKIVSKVTIQEIKNIGMSYSEEDDTMYAQLRVVAQYDQEIAGKRYVEPVEVLIFSKKHLDGDAGWQITNVDMYQTPSTSTDFHRLFFGFNKTS